MHSVFDNLESQNSMRHPQHRSCDFGNKLNAKLDEATPYLAYPTVPCGSLLARCRRPDERTWSS